MVCRRADADGPHPRRGHLSNYEQLDAIMRTDWTSRLCPTTALPEGELAAAAVLPWLRVVEADADGVASAVVEATPPGVVVVAAALPLLLPDDAGELAVVVDGFETDPAAVVDAAPLALGAPAAAALPITWTRCPTCAPRSLPRSVQAMPVIPLALVDVDPVVPTGPVVDEDDPLPGGAADADGALSATCAFISM
jgi:hypothetical protein